jgi:hypothetical protein
MYLLWHRATSYLEWGSCGGWSREMRRGGGEEEAGKLQVVQRGLLSVLLSFAGRCSEL